MAQIHFLSELTIGGVRGPYESDFGKIIDWTNVKKLLKKTNPEILKFIGINIY